MPEEMGLIFGWSEPDSAVESASGNDLRSDFFLKSGESFFSGLKAPSPAETIPTADLPTRAPSGIGNRHSLFRSKNGVVKNAARSN